MSEYKVKIIKIIKNNKGKNNKETKLNETTSGSFDVNASMMICTYLPDQTKWYYLTNDI